MLLKKVADEINRCFKDPFLPNGFVSARINDRGDFVLQIGTRDMQLRDDGSFVGAGTDLTRHFDIVEHEAEPIIVEEE